MTQPTEAVGGANDTVVAAEPTIEDRFAAAIDVQDEPDKKDGGEDNAEAATPQGDGNEEVPELSADDLDDDAGEAGDDDLQPIKPPASFTAEEKAQFAEWPREAQEAVTRRVGDLEKGLHAKTQEARQARAQIEEQATTAIQQLRQAHAQQLQMLMPQIAPAPSRDMLDVNSNTYDPDAYHYLKSVHDDSLAQVAYVQQQLQAVQAQHAQAEQAARQQAFQNELETLKEALPEWFDPTEGPKLHEQMKSIAQELGYSAEQLNDATANEILALKKVSDLKAKADKYDTLMAQKMEQVRAAKGLPKVSRPGVSRGKGAVANERYTADRQAMRGGDRDAEARVFSRFL